MYKIVLIKGTSQYDALSFFTDNLAKEFTTMGNEVEILDLESKDLSSAIQRIYRNGCDFVVSFNAVGIDLAVVGSEELILNQLKVPFIAIMVDNPILHSRRLNMGIHNFITTYVDKTHVDFVNKQFPALKTCCFLPHGGSNYYENFIAENENMKKDIDVLFMGTFSNPESQRVQWLNFPKSLYRYVSDMCDEMLSKDCENVFEAYEKVGKSIGFNQNTYQRSENAMSIMITVENYVRNYKRLHILKELLNSNIKVKLCGNGFDDSVFSQYKTFSSREAVKLSEAGELMKKSKIVLNICTFFPNGSHERVFNTMMNNSVSLTNENEYLSEEFVDNKEILFYSWTDIKSITGKVDNLLSNKSKLEEISYNGKLKTQMNHTWKNRAEKIIEFYELNDIL